MAAAPVYVTSLGRYLPNDPVDNDSIEPLLGEVNGRSSRARRLTLRNNGIRSRYYALDPRTREPTHDNAELTALAIRAALERAGLSPAALDLLVCGTSTPDQLLPGHANMVHAQLEGARAIEVVTTAGVCASGMAAFKHAWLCVQAGLNTCAAATGSELTSSFMLARNFATQTEAAISAAEQFPELVFEQDFLRWMLSDGAGAALLSPEPNPVGRSLRVEWIEGMSFAHQLPVCMYAGAERDRDGRLRGWRTAQSPQEAARQHYFNFKQDARLLNEQITRLVSAETIGAMAARHGLRSDDVDWFLPHYSSEFFKPRLTKSLAEGGFPIDESRWFSNLAQVGNVGSASLLLMLEALFDQDRLRPGQRILCFVPESARFCVYYMLLTVV